MNERLRQIAADVLGEEPTDISATTSMLDTPTWDSMAHLNLLLSVEQAFGVTIAPEEFLTATDIGAIQALIEKHLKG